MAKRLNTLELRDGFQDVINVVEKLEGTYDILDELAGVILATLKVNIDAGSILFKNEEGKAVFAKLMQDWKKSYIAGSLSYNPENPMNVSI